MGSSYVVFEIGEKNIKLLEGSYDKGKINIRKFSMLRTPAATLQRGMIIDSKALVDLITTEIGVRGIKATKAILVLSGDLAINREITVPKVTEKELATIVPREAVEFFPVDLEGYKLDYKILDTVVEDEVEKYKVYVSAVPTEIIKEYVNIIQLCGLTPKVVDIATNTLAKLATLEISARGEDISRLTAVIDLGHATTRLVMLESGKIRFEKVISLGAGKLVEMIASAKAIDYDKAAEVLNENFQSYAIDIDNNTVSLENRIGKVIYNNLCGSIVKLFDFYSSRNENAVIEKLLFTGGGMRIPGMSKVISQYIGIQGELLTDLKCINNKANEDFKAIDLYMPNVLGGLIRE